MAKENTLPTGKHPEKAEDEIFLGNFRATYFPNLGWKTKRPGKNAYDAHGNTINESGLFPVFVKKSEAVEDGFTVTENEDIFS